MYGLDLSSSLLLLLIEDPKAKIIRIMHIIEPRTQPAPTHTPPTLPPPRDTRLHSAAEKRRELGEQRRGEEPVGEALLRIRESLVTALPPDDADDRDDGITCDFLLRLLRAGSMVGADAALLGDLESRAARRLDQASLDAVMIPAFGLWHGAAAAHDRPVRPCATLLDVPLVLRLVRGFLREGAKAGGGGAAAARVARLVDAYLAEAVLEAGLRPAEFEELARAVPAHARAADDGLYRAVDTYLKAWLLFLYTSFALRENVLIVNGSDIRPWWIYHHYLAMLMALVSLTWEIKGQADCSSKQVYDFFFRGSREGVQLFLRWAIMQGIAMHLQNRYQRQRLRTRIALGKAKRMDVVAGETAGVEGQLLLLYPVLFIL